MFLNRKFIEKEIIQKDKWSEGHGVISSIGYLGTSILYFALAHMLPAKVAVILGSGGGFVPRLIRQAQREIFEENFSKASRSILIDAGFEDIGFGSADYHDDPSHLFKTSYPDIEIWKMTTDEAAKKLKEENISIDYLHIDADHTFAQSLKDFENYLPLMGHDFIITLHDTAVNHLDLVLDGCVPRTIAYLRSEMKSGGKYENLEMVNFNNRFRNQAHPFDRALHCRGIAIVTPKTCSLWDTDAGGLFCLGNISTPNPIKSDS